MAGGTMNKAKIAIALPLLALLAACNMGTDGNASSGDSAQGELAGARIGAPFTLTDQDGKPRSWDDFKGQYRLVYFGYTYCPDVCPVDLQRIMQAFSQFEKAQPALAAKVQPIFISVDPARDTPAVLKPYVAAFHPRLIGLTGTPEQIARVAKDFVVLYNVDGKPGDKDYLVSHSRTPYLFDPDGKPVALVPVDDPGTPNVDEGAPDKVLAALRKWVK
ncbi:MAG: SCO family protein [Pseudomonadota bacterium]|uniref:SCO family protein n=1 Tax=Sphingobium xenophagum TaxID=121428 RepID=A0A249MSA0_SPHXE|nr:MULTISPECIES: SCO family protein [Sphingobium]ASY44007.1 SCO family protein [Sphingobium xenophagum]ODT88568.1 MAG: electron transporter [Sphingobium sp. SCN 64-10]OUC55980.1 SCO family protein [Sphingobium sp. GW456-12-10-14-TSB1]QWT12814.1 SCO family protein [Sphingobium xenophagum]